MRLPIALAAAVAVLSSCGGSSSEGGATLASVTPEQLTVSVYAGRGGPSGELTLRAGGDVAALNGATIYVVVDASSTLFDTPSLPQVDTRDASLTLTLTSSAVPAIPGTYYGTIALHACFDPVCARELEGSPKFVAYEVTILPGLSLAEEAVNVVVPFGTEVPDRRIPVQLPDGATSWRLMDMYGAGQVWAAEATDGSAAVDVHFELWAPGVYQHDYIVQTSVLDPVAGTTTFQASLSLLYEVTATASPVCVVTPADASYAFTFGPWTQGHGTSRLTCQVAGTTTWSRVYVSAPAEAAGHPLVNDWLALGDFIDLPYMDHDYFVAPCGYVVTESNWLPAGTYEAVARYVHTEPGGAVNQYDQPITMTIAR